MKRLARVLLGAGADVEFAPRSIHNGTHVLRNATEQHLSIGVWVFSQAFVRYRYQRWWKIGLKSGQQDSEVGGYNIKTMPGAFPVWAEVEAEIIEGNVPTGRFITIEPVPLGTITTPDTLEWGVVGEWPGGGFTFPRNTTKQHTFYVTNRTGVAQYIKPGEYLFTVDGGSYSRHDHDTVLIAPGETKVFTWNFSMGGSVGARRHYVGLAGQTFEFHHVIVT